jgi:hypothetical protein
MVVWSLGSRWDSEGTGIRLKEKREGEKKRKRDRE